MFKFFLVLLFLFVFVFPAFANPYAINVDWFGNFNDEVLMCYILEALENNKDAKIARKNILKYRQEKNLKISEEFPYAAVGADYLLLKVPKLAIPNNDIQTNSFALPFMTVWEVDYLGKKYNNIQKSRFDIENMAYELKSTGIIVAVDLASAYFNVSNLNEQIEFQNKIRNLSKEILKRKQKMFDYGVISKTELNNSEDDLLREENSLEELYKQRAVFLTEIAYLLGKSPSNLSEIKITPFKNINFTGVYPESLRGDIVLNRPDILKADNEIKKSKIDVTIAKKDFLPSINVFGIMVFSTFVQNFGWDGVFAALTAGATQTLFDGGKRIFTLKKRKIEYETAVENYLKADLNALKEVNDALYTLKKDFIIFKNNEKRLNVADSNFIRVFKSYSEGTKSYIDYLDENTRYIRADKTFLDSKNQNFINLLSLYKAVGGAL